jgi:hypothetical protein
LQEPADDRVGRALNDLGDTAFRPVFTVLPNDAGLDPVFVQHCTHFVGGQVDVSLAVIALHKAVAVPVAGNRAFKFGKKAGGLALRGMIGFDKSSLSLKGQTLTPTCSA